MATIKAIEGRTVHQIQSGQVIVDLCSVVKELVENSLDAGATSIDVRFKNQGLESIEVQDNGDGISPNNYETLALKHHTSKLSTYSDLTTLRTFGFRGEALSSLCALSRFSVTTCRGEDAPKGTKLEFEVSGKLKGTSVVAAQTGTTVSVETLFNNLPVRRRELERNIKREWGRVVGVLGQYACIQTGIKFSVSQQAGKGKKTTLFSTKGNQTTRENIVNVFGAKTLTALVPLDLDLELEPTSAPSQRWSTQEDGEKKDIRIVGHISRPASGEGRQTPDRQMFFVNARPCGLPQVAKAFNEVYKAYNGSQSPFIFANIELDTHMYDVNVSPDKRTILLHDQTRMLENLKEALTALFESQDYTVPISQLPAQKQPSYKQLTISRENTVAPKPPQAPSEITEAEESEDGSKNSKRVPSTDDEEEASMPSKQKPKGAAVSRDSMSRDGQAVNLISDWLGKKTEDRSEEKTQAPRLPPRIPEGLSKDKRSLVDKLKKEGEQAQVSDDTSEEPESSVETTQASHAGPSYRPPLPVADFNRRIAELHEQHHAPAPAPASEADDVDIEPPIPALVSLSKSPPSLSSRFSNSGRLNRPSAEMATITIGEHTVTSSIGTPCPKRARTNMSSTTHSTERNAAAETPKPSFGNRLSQRFGAPGTAQRLPSSEDGEGAEGEEEEEENGGSEDGETQDIPEEVESPTLFVEDGSDEGQQVQLETDDIVEEGEEGESATLKPTNPEDEDYLDESEKKAREDAKVQEMIQAAEDAAILPSQENVLRAKGLLKGGSKRKDSTFSLVKSMDVSYSTIKQQFHASNQILSTLHDATTAKEEDEALDSEKAEEKLSLTISKTDFAKMKIIGQFNLGFILASRASTAKKDEVTVADDLFIIDQHASDEKYNFERLQETTIVQSQRLVYPKTLDLTALEEEIVLENLKALETNGFIVTVDESGESPVGQRCQLVALPLSRETTFSLEDLDELLAILTEHPPGSVPRPSKVRKMFAMRACRSSIMIGKTLTGKQMEKVVRHMGEIDKPWNCPHGRPTMRHLCGLGVWDELGWTEGDEPDGEKAVKTNWAGYIRAQRGDIEE
ncbi:Mismatch repair endonuclease [Lachnellula occidentalis]|uniref:DNA mismatch repair protein PMS1 n=1 Tax=Lachnellula occidentalis TaxID=215460 RepID=A0A8H8S304_9HELO|nr:Mismatch repair endonuclease [Lachnellula occidentalis]